MTIVGAKRLAEREGEVTATVPKVVRVDTEVIAPLLSFRGGTSARMS